ncbi:bi-domain-containing oxidoreductase [Pelagicoccus mobilis]|uniref:Bi-domain-containing oxidoreductase n=1 Tax=Pelagicoccus mobilis TaxID=415221 RepID=A0A934VQ39_9BACT|nr:bi-domain-containing oxidoreductase [Pelagicoccus mobilis]MBK1877942.1 bi-domain-containing oxidoreductase [Pelagicoccus mobilis]
MKQILQSYRNGRLWLADVPGPKCGECDVKIRVESSVVSAGTEKRMVDLAKSSLLQKAMKRPDQVQRIIQKIRAEGLAATWEQVNARLDAPVPLGYSLCGTVVETGVGASDFVVGKRVAAAGAGFASHAQFVTVPRNLVAKLPTGLTTEEGAFGTVGAIAMQAVRQAEVAVGEYVGVIGLGLIGNLVAQICVAAGARVAATDLDSVKRDLASELGVEQVGLDIREVALRLALERGLDKIIIAAGTQSSALIRACPAALRHRGRIIVLGFVGMDCPHQDFYDKEIELRMSMSYGPGRYDPEYEERGHDYPYSYVRWTEQRNIESFLHLVAQGRIDVSKLVTHRFSFENALDAYELLESKTQFMGIVLDYPSSSVEGGERDHSTTETGLKNDANQGDPCLALIGAGNFAKGIIAPLLKRLKVPVHAVATTRGASAKNSAEHLNAEFATTDVETAISDASVTHVLIATRHEAHASLAEQALRAGKLVHVEKPLCTSREQLGMLKETVAELRAEGRINVGFNRRFSPVGNLMVKELRANADSPMTVTFRVNAGSLDPDHWFYQDPGGRLTAEGCHFIDYCMFLVNRPVLSVSCAQQGQSGRAFDSFVITLVFEDGSQGVIVYSGQGDRSLSKERIEVYQAGTSWILDDWAKLWKFSNGARSKIYSGKQEKGWREELEHFLGIEERPDLAPSWSSIVNVHRVMFDTLDTALGASVTR